MQIISVLKDMVIEHNHSDVKLHLTSSCIEDHTV